jgi:hypothetical protein
VGCVEPLVLNSVVALHVRDRRGSIEACQRVDSLY